MGGHGLKRARAAALATRGIVECCTDVHNYFGVGFHPCGRRASVERNGKWYCGQHDPIAVQARMDKRHAEYDIKNKAEQKLYAKQKARADTWPLMLKLLREAPTFGGEPKTAFGLEYREWHTKAEKLIRAASLGELKL